MPEVPGVPARGGASAAARALLRRPLLCALVFAAVAAFAGISAHTLWSPDEPREAQMAKEMLDHGASALPTLGGEPFLEKPPLFFWLAALSYRCFGVSEWAERVPAALGGLLATLFAFSIARAAAGRRAGLVAAVVAASFSTFWSVSHRGVNDAILGAAVAGAHALLVRARPMAERGQGWLCALGAGFAAGVAFMTKGIVGPALVAGPATLVWLALRDGLVLRRVFPWLALFCGLFIAAFGVPWAVALAGHPGGWQNVYDCTLGQMLGRMTGDAKVGPHSQPPWYYFVSGWGAIAPWAAAVPAMFAVPSLRRRFCRRPLLDALLMFVAGIVLLSIPSGKRTPYLYPLMPVAAVAPAVWLARLRPQERLGRRGLQWAMALAAVACALIGAGALAIALGWTPPVAQFAKLAKFAPLARFRDPPAGYAVAVACIVLGAPWCLRLFLRLRADRTARAGVREFVLFAAVALVLSHAVGRRFLEPMNVLKPAAQKIAAAIPKDEPAVAYYASETLRAMMPFYGGRTLVHTKCVDVLATMQRVGARHLIVMNDTAIQPPRELLARFRPVARTDEDEGFDVTVWELVE